MRGEEREAAPAYPSAKFNADGICIIHSTIRLSKLAPDGTYKTIRKICPKCGAATSQGVKAVLHEQRKMNEKRKKELRVPRRGSATGDSVRDDNSGSGCASGGSRGKTNQGRKKSNKGQPDRYDARAHTNTQGSDSSSGHKNKCATRRSRRKTVSCQTVTSSAPSSPINRGAKIPPRPSSSSEAVKKKVTAAKIEELVQLMPPLYQERKKKKLPFDENGCCRAHPEVQLAKKIDHADGWEVVRGVCPMCCCTAVLACQQDRSGEDEEFLSPTSADSIIGKVLITRTGHQNVERPQPTSCDDCADSLIGKILTTKKDSRVSPETLPTVNSFSGNPTPELIKPKPAFSAAHFTSANRNIVGLALDIDEGERLVKELNISQSSVERNNASHKKKSTEKKAFKEPPGHQLEP